MRPVAPSVNPCFGCVSCLREVGWNPLDCKERDTDGCVEFRLRRVVREQWIYEQTPPTRCRTCGSQRHSHVEHPELKGVLMRYCGACGTALGPVEASPLEVARMNVRLFGRSQSIARELLSGCCCALDLAAKIGFEFVPCYQTPAGSEAYERIQKALAKGVPVAVVLAMLGAWV